MTELHQFASIISDRYDSIVARFNSHLAGYPSGKSCSRKGPHFPGTCNFRKRARKKTTLAKVRIAARVWRIRFVHEYDKSGQTCLEVSMRSRNINYLPVLACRMVCAYKDQHQGLWLGMLTHNLGRIRYTVLVS